MRYAKVPTNSSDQEPPTMLDPNEVYHGDCLELMKQLPCASVDMVLCDLPYGTTKCKWDVVLPFGALWEQYRRIIKPAGVVLLFGTEPFSSALRLSNLPMYRYDWYWQKDKGANFLFANKQPLKVIETVSVFYAAQPTYNPQKTINPKGESKRHLSRNPSKISKNVRAIMGDGWKETEMGVSENYFGRDYDPKMLLPKQLIYFAKDQRNKLHPTQKPVALCEYLIKTYTNEGELVLDNCAGSGTTGVACLNTRRNFILMEKNEEYVGICKQRLSQPGPQ